jgi:hypothetical protein
VRWLPLQLPPQEKERSTDRLLVDGSRLLSFFATMERERQKERERERELKCGRRKKKTTREDGEKKKNLLFPYVPPAKHCAKRPNGASEGELLSGLH